jgi:folate-dependent phosphoribosylglycinamide formyltransferase PurN
MRIAVLTFESPQADAIIERLLAARPGEVCGVVRSQVLVEGKTRWEAVGFMLRRTGLGFVVRKGLDILLHPLAGWLAPLLGGRRVPSLRELADRHDVPVVGAADVNAPEALAALRGWRPDLLISVNLNQRIREPLLGLAPRGVINVHGSVLPRNRGLFPYFFWALVHGDRETGATVHWVDTKFDTGDVILQDAFPIAPDDTVSLVSWKSTWLGADLLLRALDLIARGEAPRVRQDGRGARYCSWPTVADVRRLFASGRRYGTLTGLEPDRPERPPLPPGGGRSGRTTAAWIGPVALCRPSRRRGPS